VPGLQNFGVLVVRYENADHQQARWFGVPPSYLRNVHAVHFSFGSLTD